ncbi:hypothetical protein QAD02_009651, partial [Eretmocerus hayati]
MTLRHVESLDSQNARFADLDEFPSVVSIGYKDAYNPITSQFCSGTVITRKHVMTHSLCLLQKSKSRIQVFGGSTDILLCDRYDVESWIKYNKWALANKIPGEPWTHQIAILTLQNAIDETKMQPAYLTSKPLMSHNSLRATIVGWGMSNDIGGSHVIRAADVQSMDKKECEKTAATTVRKAAVADQKIICTDTEIVLSEEDVGGPVFYNKNILVAVNMEITKSIHWTTHKMLNFHTTYNNYVRFIYEATQGFCDLLNYGWSLEGKNVRFVKPNEFTSVVTIGSKDGDPVLSQFCMGTVITRKHVLTAGICLGQRYKTKIQVLGGSNDVSLCDEYDIQGWITYNAWAADNEKPKVFSYHQLAVITLWREIDQSKITPAYLWNKPLKINNGYRATIVGHGFTNDIPRSKYFLAADAKVVNNQECIDGILSKERLKALTNDKMICTEPDSLLSEEDTGGPIFYRNNILVAVNMREPRGTGSSGQKLKNFHITYNEYRRFIYDATK